MTKKKQEHEKKKRGRPTNYTFELAKEMCDKIANCNKGIRRLCSENEHWPCYVTFKEWKNSHPEFATQYVLAKQDQMDFYSEEIIEISDDSSQDHYTDSEGNLKFDKENVLRSKLRVDSRKWLTGKLAPKVYGDKIQQEVTQQFSFDRMNEITDEELEKLVSACPERIHQAFLKHFAKKIKERDKGKVKK